VKVTAIFLPSLANAADRSVGAGKGVDREMIVMLDLHSSKATVESMASISNVKHPGLPRTRNVPWLDTANGSNVNKAGKAIGTAVLELAVHLKNVTTNSVATRGSPSTPKVKTVSGMPDDSWYSNMVSTVV
jgi:hypothetical protein